MHVRISPALERTHVAASGRRHQQTTTTSADERLIICSSPRSKLKIYLSSQPCRRLILRAGPLLSQRVTVDHLNSDEQIFRGEGPRQQPVHPPSPPPSSRPTKDSTAPDGATMPSPALPATTRREGERPHQEADPLGPSPTQRSPRTPPPHPLQTPHPPQMMGMSLKFEPPGVQGRRPGGRANKS